jgi:hypothetical protein
MRLCQDLVRLGESESCVSHAVNDSHVNYEASALLKAAYVCINATFVFGIEFLPAARSSWLYLQRAVFNIITDVNSVASRVL